MNQPCTPETSGPLTVGQMLSRIAALLRGHLRFYLGLAVLPAGTFLLLYPLLLWALYAAGAFPPAHAAPDPRQSWMVSLAIFCILPPFMAAYVIYEAANCKSTLAALHGQPVSFAHAYRYAGRRAARLIWLVILRSAIAMLPMMLLAGLALVAIAGAASSGVSHPGATFLLAPLAAVLLLGSFVVSVWISLYIALAVPACVAEDIPAWTACRRSGLLSRGGKGRIFVVLFLVGLIGMAAIFALELVLFALMGVGTLASMLFHLHAAGAARIPLLVILAVVALAGFYLVLALQWSSYSVALTVLYEDQRQRLEALPQLPPAPEPA